MELFKDIKNLGKLVRLERIFNRESEKTVIVPMDHGVSNGPIKGLIDIRETVNDVAVPAERWMIKPTSLP